MAMIVGQAKVDPVTGMAGAVYNALVSTRQAATITVNSTPVHLCPTPITAQMRVAYAAEAEAIATGVVQYIQANAAVVGSAVT